MKLVSNKKLGLTYSVNESIEAGIELLGLELKSLRKKQGSVDGGKIIIRGGEAFAVGIFIPPYQENNTPKDYDPYRTRKLLLKKSDMIHILNEEKSSNLTIIPISLYLKNNLVKCEVGLCKKKLKNDKREDLKKKSSDRAVRNIKHSGRDFE